MAGGIWFYLKNWGCFISIWLVVLTMLKNMKVNGWWIISYIMGNKSHD